MVARSRYQEDLAYIHHVGFGGFAREASPWVIATLARVGISRGLIVELGCGSGILLQALAAAGYRAHGVDDSAAMLRLARPLVPAARFTRGSLHAVKIPPCAAVIAMGEGLSYVDSARATPSTARLFARVATALEPGGLFLFDVLVRTRRAQPSYRTWASGEDWAVLVEVTSSPSRPNLRRSVTTFRRVGESYRRSHEEHFAHRFSRRELAGELRDAGFQVRIERSYGAAALGPGRLLFCCRRV